MRMMRMMMMMMKTTTMMTMTMIVIMITILCYQLRIFYRMYFGSAERRKCHISSQHVLPSERSAILLLHRRLDSIELG